jgi:RNA polymerase sigma-70 factor (ECF subfamily)
VLDDDRVAESEVERVFRADSGRAVATLVRLLGDIGLAEEAVQDAFAVALERWPRDGVPPSPTGWIVTTARNRAIDRMRREATRMDRYEQAALLLQPQLPEEEVTVHDDRLRLVFTCCHPALSADAQVALTLRLIAGLQTREIARAFLVPEATMAQRLVRAKNKIRAARIPYRVPDDAELPERLRPVLAVVYLVFNEGYLSSGEQGSLRDDLTAEAIRLGRLLAELMPDEPEVAGLLALMLLTESRRRARLTSDGELVRLADQDRTLWDGPLVAEGQDIVRRCLRRNSPGPYQLQAAIAAVHSDAESIESTDWSQVLALYDHLFTLAPTPVVALNRAIAAAEVDGPGAALEVVDGLGLHSYHLWHATRGDLLERLGRTAEAREAYVAAMEGTGNAAERALLERRRDAVG